MSAKYSIPSETDRLFKTGILENPLILKDLPAGTEDASRPIFFEGSDAPSLPVNWRFAESVSALKALEATVLNVLLKRKYGLEPARVKINTDHAQLFIMSTLLWTLDPKGNEPMSSALFSAAGHSKIADYFKNCDIHKAYATPFRVAATNIYQTKDSRFFHLHGSMNPEPTLQALQLPINKDFDSLDDAVAPFKEAVHNISSSDLQELVDAHRQAGTVCWTAEEYRNGEHGQANAKVGLFEIHARPNLIQPPCWWPDAPRTSAARPLAGLKVVDLTRVIAAPTVTRGLAELGASVMRITAPHLADMSGLHPDLNHGKWNACLDLREEQDRLKLRALVEGADVFVQGYRPGVLEKYGFGEEDIMDMCRGRARGIVYCAEDCYGWQGPWKDRSGWQQISDAFGRAMGNDEPVTPVFPNSDYCTGIAGVVGILTALLRRAEEGGSWTVKLALNYYSQWLVNSCGTYPPEVWQDVWQRNGSPVYRHYHPMQYLLPRVMATLREHCADRLFRPEFFTDYRAGVLGKDMRIVAPVLRFPDGEVEPGFHVGTRGNGVDQPKWPESLDTEVVT